MKIVLAYSGGLDTSVILKWLQEEYRSEVIAFCADLGQEDDFAQVRDKAVKTGASKVYVEDLREEFASDFVFPLFRAGAVYEGYYLLGTSVARPLIARKQVEIARLEKADAVAHGATGKGNDQVRFEIAYHTLEPTLEVIAPWRLWDLTSRTRLMAYAAEHGIPVPSSPDKPYSVDQNLLHTSYEGGILEDPWQDPPEGMFLQTVSPERAPDKSEEITLDFEAGNAVAVNGEALSPARLLGRLNMMAGRHGIGRVDIVENRYVGMKSRGVYETPGGTVLYHAHRAVESLTLDREEAHLKDSFVPKYAELVYNGYWFSPEREMLQAAVDECQKNVTGTVRLKLFKGNVIVRGRRSPNSLYDPEIATFEEGADYRQRDAEGFIRLNALRLKTRSLVERKNVN